MRNQAALGDAAVDLAVAGLAVAGPGELGTQLVAESEPTTGEV